MRETDRARYDAILDDLDVDAEFDAPIGEAMTWFRIGGRAEVLVRPRSQEALQTLLRRADEVNNPIRVLGSGANLLIADNGIDGIVVHLSAPAFRQRSSKEMTQGIGGGGFDSSDRIRVWAGTKMERLVMAAARQGLAGLEMMAGIPATLGGATRMNAGGKFGSIGDVVRAVACLDRRGRLTTYDRSDLTFEYRNCVLDDAIVLWADLEVRPDDPARVHKRVKEIFEFKKESQPLAEHTAGCVFKNPTDMNDTGKRVSAGYLIDRAGLKGTSVGGASVSVRHANFISASKDCRAGDIITLIELIQERVRDHSGYELERELIIWRRT
jgi:UDP-N-acetylmuramate dehydrogenase